MKIKTLGKININKSTPEGKNVTERKENTYDSWKAERTKPGKIMELKVTQLMQVFESSKKNHDKR